MPNPPRRPFARRISQLTPFKVMEVLDAVTARQAAGEDIIRMEVGEPVFDLPPRMLDAARDALERGDARGYTPSMGLPALRAAVAGFYRQRHGIDLDPARVVITTGSSAALGMLCDLLLDPGDSLLLTDPGYPCNANFVLRCDATPLRIPVRPEHHYQPRPEDVAAHWRDTTAGLLVASPGNPTGDRVDPGTLAALHRAVSARGGALIVDEIYHGLSYDGNGDTSALEIADDVYVINSFSKYFAMPGWRLGWMVVPEAALEPVRLMTQNFHIAPPTIAQHTALAAFHPDSIAIFEARRAALQERRDYLVNALRDLGFGIPRPPPGAFYIYCNIAAFSDDGETFCRDMLARAGVAITPGTDFGAFRAREHVRFSYTAEPLPRLREAVARLARVLHAP
ncbi:MAG: aminotransferase class I/II-fold pyridoxal phosphate-dependent enzyme [Porticoccaceae bacterium]|jgi:aspartate/methionine/tyrosine aminotransferase|nr:aminotransferase class I/II-fold pyridoxal phosphate-dependent enzyme [Porticoccaceae bacterium]